MHIGGLKEPKTTRLDPLLGASHELMIMKSWRYLEIYLAFSSTSCHVDQFLLVRIEK